MEIDVVTSNVDKFKEIEAVLRDFNIIANHTKMEMNELGDNLEAVAEYKAKYAYAQIEKPLIVDDTGIFFQAFVDFPGHLAKRVYQEIGYDGLMQKLKSRHRHAYFKTVICFVDGARTDLFTGVLRGYITEDISKGGKDDLPYERIFMPQNRSIPLAMFSIDAKAEISHRAKATEKFARWFQSRNIDGII